MALDVQASNRLLALGPCESLQQLMHHSLRARAALPRPAERAEGLAGKETHFIQKRHISINVYTFKDFQIYLYIFIHFIYLDYIFR